MSYLIFIYNDYGVSEISVEHMKRTLSDLYTLSTIKLVNGREVEEGQLINDEKEKFDLESRLFCLGGGFDLGYISSLGDKGCEEIRRFVTSGGHYLGICAGAYFASSMVLFDRSGPLEVVGERKLKFFTGSTIGPCNIRFKYKSEDETKAVKVKIDGISKDYYLYLNGGCYFEEQLINENNNHEIIGRYDEANNDPDLIEGLNEKPALVASCLGKGSILLSGVHFEFDADKLDLDNHNIKANVYPKLNGNEIDSKLHSNQFLIRYLFNKVFLFE